MVYWKREIHQCPEGNSIQLRSYRAGVNVRGTDDTKGDHGFVKSSVFGGGTVFRRCDVFRRCQI
jgi:hypothetical protein